MARDADHPSPPRSEVFPSLTAELIFAANLVASAPGLRTGVGDGWVDALRGEMAPEALAAAAALSDFWWPTMGLVDFLCWNSRFHDPQAFVDEVASVPIDQFLTVLFNGDFTLDQVRGLLDDPGRIPEATRVVGLFSRATPEAYGALFADPEGHRRRLLGLVLAADTPWFRGSFDQLASQARGSVQTITRRLLAEDPLLLAESLRGRPLRGPRAFDRFTFVPSLLIGHRNIQSWGGVQAVFFLQEGVIALDSPTETGAELAETLKVLGDKTRMDILRLLSCAPSFGKEIAHSLGLTSATVSRHLDQLKAIGVVKEEKADATNVKLLRFDADALDLHLTRLRNYLQTL